MLRTSLSSSPSMWLEERPPLRPPSSRRVEGFCELTGVVCSSSSSSDSQLLSLVLQEHSGNPCRTSGRSGTPALEALGGKPLLFAFLCSLLPSPSRPSHWDCPLTAPRSSSSRTATATSTRPAGTRQINRTWMTANPCPSQQQRCSLTATPASAPLLPASASI